MLQFYFAFLYNTKVFFWYKLVADKPNSIDKQDSLLLQAAILSQLFHLTKIKWITYLINGRKD